MSKKNKLIRNSHLDITEEDVKICEDILQLNEWLIHVRKDINIMDGKIKKAKADKSIGKEISEEWMNSIDNAKRIQERFAELIINRISSLKENSQETYQFEVNFVEEACKSMESGEMEEWLYNALKERARGYSLEEEGEKRI